MKRNTAFTMLELIVVMIILGVLVIIAVPNFNRQISRAQVQDAKNNLMAIYAAQQNLFARTGAYLRNPAVNVNAGLSLSVVSNDINYVCGADPADAADVGRFACTATQVGGNNFVMRVTNVPVVLYNLNPYAVCGAADANGNAYNPCCSSGNNCQ